jgi:hypothetical protein
LIEKELALADRIYALARGSIVLEARTDEADLPQPADDMARHWRRVPSVRPRRRQTLGASP